jgi:hypothetical protein
VAALVSSVLAMNAVSDRTISRVTIAATSMLLPSHARTSALLASPAEACELRH